MPTRLKSADPTVVSDLQRPLWNRSAAAYADVFKACRSAIPSGIELRRFERAAEALPPAAERAVR